MAQYRKIFVIFIIRMEKLNTNIDLKYFGKRANIERKLTDKREGENYVCEINHNNTNYVLKGYKINLGKFMVIKEAETLTKMLSKIDEAYQDFFAVKAVHGFDPKFTQALALAYKVDLNLKKDEESWLYIEALFKYPKLFISWGLINFNSSWDLMVAYNFMEESANTLLLVHNTDMKEAIDISNAVGVSSKGSMFPDKVFKNYILDINGKLRTIIKEYAPPEVLELDQGENIHADIGAIEVYSWAMRIYSLLLNKSSEELVKVTSQSETKKLIEYNKNLSNLEREFSNLVSPEQEIIKDVMKRVLSKAMWYVAKDRPKMNEIVSEIRTLTKRYNIQSRYTVAERREKFVSLLLIDNEKPGRMKAADSKIEKSKLSIEEKKTLIKANAKLLLYNAHMSGLKNLEVELSCGHAVSKDYLAEYVLRLLLEERSYRHYCLCPTCEDTSDLKSLRLSCGCTVRKFHEEVEYNFTDEKIDCGTCNNKHPLTPIDLCCVNHNVPFECLSLALSDYLREKDDATLIEMHDNILSKQELDTIIKILKLTNVTTQLRLRKKRMPAKVLRKVIEVLKTNESVLLLDLGNCSLMDEGAEIISELLGVNKIITTLILDENPIKDRGLIAISEGLKVNMTLISVNLDGNKGRDEGIKAIVEAFKVNKKVAEIRATSAGHYSKFCVKPVIDLLRLNRTLVVLAISHIVVDGEVEKILGDVLKNNKTLKELDIRKNYMGHKAVIAFSNALKTNKALQKLNISDSKIGEIGAISISKALLVNKTLKELDVSLTGIGDYGAAAIVEANKVIAKLNLSHNKFKFSHLWNISKTLEANKTITSLHLVNDSINDFGMKFIFDIFVHSKWLRMLNIEENHVSSKSAPLLSNMIKAYKGLKELYLGKNKLGNKSAVYIAEALEVNTTLEELDLRSSLIGDEGAIALYKALKLNKTITNLNLLGNDSDASTERVFKEDEETSKRVKIETKAKKSIAYIRLHT
eukprot:TRINITY_DN2242_c0_g1_i4.p1 TRINITY_DN2242_c0_g1~~TRINITY_DN2242_c0_g1_i4.p1  ORF type:complete len:978 (+),score=143.33 TRINITY_DN2242_c0_g1_i4:108-3041(+)